MGEVYLDGERVDFQGQEPASVGEVWQLVENHLSGEERSLESATVDGRDWNPDTDDAAARYERVELRSVSLVGQFVGLARRWLGERDETLGAVEELSRLALSRAWRETQGRAVALFETLGGAAQGLGLLLEFGAAREATWVASLKARYDELVDAMNAVADATQAGDCVSLSDALALDLRPEWAGCLTVVEREVLQALEAQEEAGG